MKYTFNCTPHKYEMKVEAKDDQEALKKLREMAKQHMMKDHSMDKPMTDAEIDKMLMSGWKKG